MLVEPLCSESVHFVTTRKNAVAFLLSADKFGSDDDGWGAAVVAAASTNEAVPNRYQTNYFAVHR